MRKWWPALQRDLQQSHQLQHLHMLCQRLQRRMLLRNDRNGKLRERMTLSQLLVQGHVPLAIRRGRALALRSARPLDRPLLT
jgi:hypothetical protein